MQALPPLPASWRDAALRISVIHRLAVLLNRNRSTRELPQIRCDATGDSLTLVFQHGWLDANPLTVADLNQETKYLRDVDFELDSS